MCVCLYTCVWSQGQSEVVAFDKPQQSATHMCTVARVWCKSSCLMTFGEEKLPGRALNKHLENYDRRRGCDSDTKLTAFSASLVCKHFESPLWMASLFNLCCLNTIFFSLLHPSLVQGKEYTTKNQKTWVLSYLKMSSLYPLYIEQNPLLFWTFSSLICKNQPVFWGLTESVNENKCIKCLLLVLRIKREWPGSPSHKGVVNSFAFFAAFPPTHKIQICPSWIMSCLPTLLFWRPDEHLLL